MLFLLFIVIPIIEIALFIAMGDLIGFWPSIAIVVLTALIGSIVFRSQGLHTLQNLNDALETGHDPAQAVIHGALILIAAVILCLPGYFTDIIGLLLLIPPFRSWAMKMGAMRLATQASRFQAYRTQNPSPAEERTIDSVDYTVMDDEDPK